jgi:hypothetical protein
MLYVTLFHSHTFSITRHCVSSVSHLPCFIVSLICLAMSVRDRGQGLSAVRRCSGGFAFALADLSVINRPYTQTHTQQHLMPAYLFAMAFGSVTAGALLWAWMRPRRATQLPRLVNPSASYFSPLDYEKARSEFRAAARGAGAALHTLPLQGDCWGGACGDSDAFKGPDGLTIEVAVLQGSGAQSSGPALLHMSGVHGVEGIAGSAIQTRWLHLVASGEAQMPKGVTAILVHLVNPYGFKHGRRYNENNVDLNRNCIVKGVQTPGNETLSFEWCRDSHPAKEAYQAFSYAMNWSRRWRAPWDDALFLLRAAYLLCLHKYTTLKRAAISGQYFNDKGIWFGGFCLQPSHEALLAFLRRECGSHNPIVHLDVHTGLGPCGVDTMLYKYREEVAAFCVEALGEPKQKGYIMGSKADEKNAAAGYDLTKGLSSMYLPILGAQAPGWKQGLSMTQEFGTVSPIAVIKACARENAAFVHGATQEEAKEAVAEVRDAFYVHSSAWQEAVMKRGVTVLQQLLENLHRVPRISPSPGVV